MGETLFQFVETEDGSYSARIGAPGTPLDECSEAMHSLRGAFSETVYVYGSAIHLSAEKRLEERVLSMGLGLGYVELLASAIAVKNKRGVCGESFEIVPELRTYFADWLHGSILPADFSKVYDLINERTAKETGVAPDLIKSALSRAVDTGAWRLRETLDASTEFETKFGCICFDAFSSKSTPDLWTEDFLKSFLQKTADSRCVLSTYACTGTLKRALKSEGFEVQIRQGFSSKRDSTFAVKYASQSLVSV